MSTKRITFDGKKVVDPDTSMQLIIEPQDVREGLRGKKDPDKAPMACAAALAIQRQLGAICAWVHVSRIYVEFPKRVVRYQTPASLRTQIVSFDQGGTFRPGTYTIHPLCEAHRPNGSKKGSTANSSKSRGIRKRKFRAKAHYLRDIRSMADFHKRVVTVEDDK